jgi:hypothetical protein
MPQANILKYVKAKVKHIDNNTSIGLCCPFPFPALRIVLFSVQIFVDLETDDGTEMK